MRPYRFRSGAHRLHVVLRGDCLLCNPIREPTARAARMSFVFGAGLTIQRIWIYAAGQIRCPTLGEPGACIV